MKTRNRAIGTVFLLAGAITVAVPWLIFPLCGMGRFALPESLSTGHHGCHGILWPITWIGAIVALIGLGVLFFPRRKPTLFLSLFPILLGLLVTLLPTSIIGVCKIATMPCRLGTVPALVICGILVMIAGLVGTISNRFG